MRRVLKFMLIVLAVLAMIPVAGIAGLRVFFPKSKPAAEVRIDPTPERIERGRYLSQAVLGCFGCHAQRDWGRMGAPVIAGTEGSAGLCIKPEHGAPGTICSANITPHPTAGIGSWTDGEIIRAIREGVSREGRPLFPMMPYQSFRSLSDEDVAAVVAYLRSLPPSPATSPPTELMFPVNLAIRLGPTPVDGVVPSPEAKEGVAYGRYLATVANCEGCHSNEPEKPFGGGFPFGGPWGKVVSANITPDDETGIGRLDKAAFIARFKVHASLDTSIPVPPQANSIMPWLQFAQMTEGDLGAIYDYLRTVTPVSQRIVTRPPPAPEGT